MKWIILLAGGGLGTVARYLVSNTISHHYGERFPYGTLIVNLAGCFLIGFLANLSEGKLLLNPTFRLFLIIGFLGGFTTFSAFMHETATLIKNGQAMLGLANVLASVIAGYVLFYLGIMLAEAL